MKMPLKVFVYEANDGAIFEFNSQKEMLDYIVKQVLGDDWYAYYNMGDGKKLRVVQ